MYIWNERQVPIKCYCLFSNLIVIEYTSLVSFQHLTIKNVSTAYWDFWESHSQKNESKSYHDNSREKQEDEESDRRHRVDLPLNLNRLIVAVETTPGVRRDVTQRRQTDGQQCWKQKYLLFHSKLVKELASYRTEKNLKAFSKVFDLALEKPVFL
jgi:hypothetical protein